MSEIPIILSLETSGSTTGVALSFGNDIRAEYLVFESNQHERLLAELINRILKDCNVLIEEVSAVALSSGPGSFTGLRIGAALAKGLCFDDKPKLIPVPTLNALAYNYSQLSKQLGNINIFVANHSHKDKVYYQSFNSECEELTKLELKEFYDCLLITDEKILVCGTGADLFKGNNYIILKDSLYPSYIANYAFKLLNENKFIEASKYEPLYLNDFIPKSL